MSEHVRRASIVSGYFNPLHVGHLRMMEAARSLTGRLIVIVNNDAQQEMKKGRIILPLGDRLEIVQALRITDEAVIAIDDDATVKRTLRVIREKYPEAELIFANGGDRRDPVPRGRARGGRGTRHWAGFRWRG